MALPNPVSNYITEAKYLELEANSNIKHEYANGEVLAMAGASENHSLITGNIFATFHSQLRGKPCKTHQSDLRVQVTSAGAYRYPDVTVVCGTSEFGDTTPETLLNPTLLVEVLSPTTAQIDYEYKLAEYQKIPSLQEFLIISQERPRIEVWIRQKERDTWLYMDRRGLDSELYLPSIDCTLALSDVYERVDFDTPDS